MKTRKGITPIIAIIILLLITIALAGAAWAYLQGFLFGQIAKTFVIPSGGAYCENGEIVIYALNTGYESTLTTPDFILVTVDGQDNRTFLVQDLAMQEGNATMVFRSNCGTALPLGCGPGYHTVRLGTQSTIIDPRISC